MNWALVLKLARVSLAIVAQDITPGTTSGVLIRWLLGMFNNIPITAALEATAQYRGQTVHLGNIPPEPYTPDNIKAWARKQVGYVSDQQELKS